MSQYYCNNVVRFDWITDQQGFVYWLSVISYPIHYALPVGWNFSSDKFKAAAARESSDETNKAIFIPPIGTYERSFCACSKELLGFTVQAIATILERCVSQLDLPDDPPNIQTLVTMTLLFL